MILSMIVAVDDNLGIGYENKLPWKLPIDLKRFKNLTMGHHLIMGRKTYESIGKPLPGRTTIVLSTKASLVETLKPLGVFVVHSLKEAIELAHSRGETETFICGGAEIYEQTVNIVDKVYMTVVHMRENADKFFPQLDWHTLENIERYSDNGIPCSYRVIVSPKSV